MVLHIRHLHRRRGCHVVCLRNHRCYRSRHPDALPVATVNSDRTHCCDRHLHRLTLHHWLWHTLLLRHALWTTGIAIHATILVEHLWHWRSWHRELWCSKTRSSELRHRHLPWSPILTLPLKRHRLLIWHRRIRLIRRLDRWSQWRDHGSRHTTRWTKGCVWGKQRTWWKPRRRIQQAREDRVVARHRPTGIMAQSALLISQVAVAQPVINTTAETIRIGAIARSVAVVDVAVAPTADTSGAIAAATEEPVERIKNRNVSIGV